MIPEIPHEFTDSLEDYISLNIERTFDDWLNSLSDKSIVKLEEQLFYGFQGLAYSENEHADIFHLTFKFVSMKRKRNVRKLDPAKRKEFTRELQHKVSTISFKRGLPVMRARYIINWLSNDSDS